MPLVSLKDDGSHRHIEMEPVPLVLGELIASHADVVGGFHSLGQGHKTLFQLAGLLDKLRRHIKAVELPGGLAGEIGRGIEHIKNRLHQIEMIFYHANGLLDVFEIGGVCSWHSGPGPGSSVS